MATYYVEYGGWCNTFELEGDPNKAHRAAVYDVRQFFPMAEDWEVIERLATQEDIAWVCAMQGNRED